MRAIGLIRTLVVVTLGAVATWSCAAGAGASAALDSVSPSAAPVITPTLAASPVPSATPSTSPPASIASGPLPPDVRECAVDIVFTGALHGPDQGIRLVPIGDPRYPGQWTLGTRGHAITARFGGQEREVQLILRFRDHDASGPARPVVTLSIAVIPPAPTAATSPTPDPSGIDMAPSMPLTFLHYHWVADIPPDETPSPGFSVPPAIGTAAFDGPADVVMDLVFNLPPADAMAPAGDISAVGGIDCPEPPGN